MLKKIFPFMALFFSAFLLFYPQTSSAISCKCSVETSIGTAYPNCQSFPTEFIDGSTQGCDKYKQIIVNRWNSGPVQQTTVEGTTCESFSDQNCTVPLAPEDTATSDTSYGKQDLLWWEFDLKAKKPLLEISIPGLHFSDVVSTSNAAGTFYYIPWIPELISALYKFSIGVVSIIAVITIILQGIHVVTSGGGEGKNAAYKKIGQAIIGLLIAWGSFAILYNINPATTEFNALKVKTVEPKALELISEEMRTGTKPTVENDEAQPADEYAPTFTNCPITLTNEFTSVSEPLQPRTKEFFEKIGSVITATTPAGRILQVAEAAANCNVAFGNCGRTAGNIYTLSGLKSKQFPDEKCLLTKKGCNTHEGSSVYGIPSDLFQKMRRPEHVCDKFGTAQCTEAKNKFIQLYRNDPRLIRDGWPDKIANTLKAGDAFWGYTGAPAHSMIFVKWTSKAGYAEVIDGGPSQKVKKRYRCLLSSCSDKSFTPIIRTFDPNKLK